MLDAHFDDAKDEFPPIENIDNAMGFNGELTRHVRGGADLLIQNVPPEQEPALVAAIPKVVGNQFGGAEYKAIPATFRSIKFLYVVAYSSTSLLRESAPQRPVPALQKPLPPRRLSVRELTELVLKHEGYETSKVVFPALATHPERPEAVEVLLRIARRGFISRGDAVMALISIGGPDVGAALLPLMDEPEFTFRQKVIAGLGRCRVRAAVPRLTQALAADTDEGTNAADALAEIGDKTALPALRRWLAEQVSEYRQGRFTAAICTLEAAPDGPTASHVDGPERTKVQAAIARVDHLRPRPGFFARLKHRFSPPKDTGSYIARKLALDGDPYELVRVIRHSEINLDLFYVTIAALADFRDSPDAVGMLVEVARDHSASHRRDAITALGRVGGETAAGCLIRLLDDSDFSTRQDVIASLGRCRAKSAVPRLCRSLEATDDECTHTADALAKIGDTNPDMK